MEKAKKISLKVLLRIITGVALGAIFFIALAVGWSAWRCARQPELTHPASEFSGIAVRPESSLWHPFSRPAFRALLAVFVVNGIASAIPATLILFFVQDRLQAPSAVEPLFLGSYFVCAALAMPCPSLRGESGSKVSRLPGATAVRPCRGP